MSIFVLASCKKSTTFNMNYNSSFVVSKTMTLESAVDIVPDAVTTNSSATFSTNSTNEKNIISIKLSDITFTIADPTDGNFDFMESIEIYINADGLPERLISTQMKIPESQQTSISGELPDVNLVEYLSKPTYTLRLKVITDQHITKDYKLNVAQTFKVEAKKLKS